jgi:hypothetical protein
MSAAKSIAVAPSSAVEPAQTRDVLEIFSAIAENWELSTEQQIILLGSPGRSTFFKWRKEGGTLPADTQERLSHIFSIHKALAILIPDEHLADKWMRQPNRAFGGETALEHALTSLAGLYEVRRYLDAQRGG